MSEGAAVVTKKESKKRARKMGDLFVCAATKEPLKRAIIVKFEDGSFLPFASINVASRYLHDNVADAEKRSALLAQLAADTDQSASNLPQTKSFELLALNGGSESFTEWHAELADWLALTDKYGYTQREWDAASGSKRKANKKDTKKVFDAATYLVPIKGQPKALTAGVATKVPAKGDKPESEVISDDFVAAVRKINKFAGDEKVFVRHGVFKENFHATVLQMAGIDSLLLPEADKAKTINALASHIVGNTVHGPALITFTRKCSFKPE